MSAEEGEVVWQRVCEVADTVCAHDRRARQYRLVDAFMALIHGEDRLQCLCRREDCVATGKTAPRRAPLTQVTVDVATLLGLVSNPAYLAGHGPIDPELARALAADGTWQLMLTEAFDMATALGLLDQTTEAEPVVAEPVAAEAEPEPAVAVPAVPEPVVAEAEPEPVGAEPHVTDPEVAAEPDSAETEPVVAEPKVAVQPEAADTSTDPSAGAGDTPVQASGVTVIRPRQRICFALYRGRGTRRTAGAVPKAPPVDPTAPPPPLPWPEDVLGTGPITALLTKSLTANPALTAGEFLDGHGGHKHPPPGALTYAPDAATAVMVRARDRHCRFTGCRMPAARCQLDHIIEFRHHSPHAGGWTIPSNLQCLCHFHHQLKVRREARVFRMGVRDPDPRVVTAA